MKKQFKNLAIFVGMLATIAMSGTALVGCGTDESRTILGPQEGNQQLAGSDEVMYEPTSMGDIPKCQKELTAQVTFRNYSAKIYYDVTVNAQAVARLLPGGSVTFTVAAGWVKWTAVPENVAKPLNGGLEAKTCGRYFVPLPKNPATLPVHEFGQ